MFKAFVVAPSLPGAALPGSVSRLTAAPRDCVRTRPCTPDLLPSRDYLFTGPWWLPHKRD